MGCAIAAGMLKRWARRARRQRNGEKIYDEDEEWSPWVLNSQLQSRKKARVEAKRLQEMRGQAADLELVETAGLAPVYEDMHEHEEQQEQQQQLEEDANEKAHNVEQLSDGEASEADEQHDIMSDLDKAAGLE